MKRSKKAHRQQARRTNRRTPKATRQGRSLRNVGTLLHEYVRDRAQVEGFGYDLDPDWFTAHLFRGIRWFFGIQICGHDKLISDAQEPSPGYFAAWMAQHGHNQCSAAHPPQPEVDMATASAHWRAAADNFTDEKLLAKWEMVGARMALEEPQHFALVLEQFAGMANAVPSPAATVQWMQLGRDLLEQDRRTLAELAIASHLFLDRAHKRTATRQPSDVS